MDVSIKSPEAEFKEIERVKESNFHLPSERKRRQDTFKRNHETMTSSNKYCRLPQKSQP